METKRRPLGAAYWLRQTAIACLASILPFVAVEKIGSRIGGIFPAIYLAVLSAITVYAYWADKRKARTETWRTPESTLHLLELGGGWLAAFYSQRLFRHKISKRAYQLRFRAIAVVHNYGSFDYLNDWHYSRTAFQWIESFLK